MVYNKYAHWGKVKDKSLAGMTDVQGDGNALEDALLQMAMGSGWCPLAQVNDTETLADWTESHDGTFDATAGSNSRVGLATLAITATGACDGKTQYIETIVIDGSAPVAQGLHGVSAMDWTDSDYLGFWLYGNVGEFDADGSLKVAIVNREAGSDVVQTIHDVPAAVASIHQRVEIDISSDSRDRVTAIRFYADTTDIATGDACEVDSIIRYKVGNGKGPAMGKVMLLPIASAATVTKGAIVSIEVDAANGMAVQEESAASQVNDIGVACGAGTGVAGGTIYVPVQVGGFGFLRANALTVNGEGLIWQSEHATHGHLIEGGATGNDEYIFAKGLEAAGAQYDDILCRFVQEATFIS